MLVCLIDDDSEDAELFSEALKDVDPLVECIRFNGIPFALDHLCQDTSVPAVIFLDAHLPSGSSMEFLTAIRKLVKLSDTKIFIYSGFVSDHEKAQYRKLGATDVITKPHHFQDLRSMLQKILNGNATGA